MTRIFILGNDNNIWDVDISSHDVVNRHRSVVAYNLIVPCHCAIVWVSVFNPIHGW